MGKSWPLFFALLAGFALSAGIFLVVHHRLFDLRGGDFLISFFVSLLGAGAFFMALFLWILRRSIAPYENTKQIHADCKKLYAHIERPSYNVQATPYFIIGGAVVYFFSIIVLNSMKIPWVIDWLEYTRPTFESILHLNPGYFSRITAAIRILHVDRHALLAHEYGLAVSVGIAAALAMTYARSKIMPSEIRCLRDRVGWFFTCIALICSIFLFFYFSADNWHDDTPRYTQRYLTGAWRILNNYGGDTDVAISFLIHMLIIMFGLHLFIRYSAVTAAKFGLIFKGPIEGPQAASVRVGKTGGINMAQRDDDDTKAGLTSLKDGSTNSASIAAYYDEWAETYDETLQNWDYQAPDDAAASLCTYLKPGDKILDVGCGTGMFAKAMSRHLDCHLEGIDISAASLEIADKQGGYDRLQRHDLQTTPLPVSDHAFDAAACVGVMTYIEDAQGLLADLCRVIRPGGYLLFTQRDDRWVEKDFDSLIKDFEERGLWTPLKISKAKPYLPKNDDFSDSIRVIHVLCQVL